MTVEVPDGLLHIFNVDHGACALFTVRSEGRVQHVLIDCGHNTDFNGSPWWPGGQLKHLGIQHVDMLVVTNYDEGHMSGARSLVEQGISVGHIVGNFSVAPSAITQLKAENGMGTGTRVIVNSLVERVANRTFGQIPLIAGLEFQSFCNTWPTWTEENNLSLVCFFSYRGVGFLFTGDMERRGMLNVLQGTNLSAYLPRVNVLMAPHHGRENGKCPELFDTYWCRPELVVISDCEKRHQSQETTGYYGSKARGIPDFRGQGRRAVLTTRRDGYLSFKFAGDQCWII